MNAALRVLPGFGRAAAAFQRNFHGACITGTWERRCILDYISHSEAETEEIGRKLGETLKPGTVLAYRGDLGMRCQRLKSWRQTCFSRSVTLWDAISSKSSSAVNLPAISERSTLLL